MFAIDVLLYHYYINNRIEAPTTSINMYAEKEISIDAPRGDMTISSFKEIQMISKDSIVTFFFICSL